MCDLNTSMFGLFLYVKLDKYSIVGILSLLYYAVQIPFNAIVGKIDAKKWDAQPSDEVLLGVKKVVALDGYPLMYNGTQLQFKINDYEPIYTYNEEDLILEAPVDRKLLEEKFLGYIDAIKDNDIKTIVNEIVANKYSKLLLHPAAKTNHHEYAGGLLHHEVSMLDLANQVFVEFI